MSSIKLPLSLCEAGNEQKYAMWRPIFLYRIASTPYHPLFVGLTERGE